MSDIFISYASEDRSRAQILAQVLEKLGWSVWWDRAIPAGRTFAEVIEEALANARCIIVLWSRISIKKEWVREEAEEGKKRRILIPVLIDQVDPPMGFRLIQAADLIEWEGVIGAAGFNRLVEDITNIIGKPPISVHELIKNAEDEAKRKAEEDERKAAEAARLRAEQEARQQIEKEQKKTEEERRTKEEEWRSEEEKLKRKTEEGIRKGQEEEKKRKHKAKFALIGFAVLIVILMIGYLGIKPKPAPTPYIPPKDHRIFTPTEIQNFIENHLRASVGADVDTFLDDYAEKVDYYSAGVVNKDFIRKDKEYFNKRWPKRTYTIIGEIQTANTSYDDEKIVQFTYDYYVQSENKSTRGRANNSIRVKKIDNVLKIIGEKQEVVKRGSE
jgi:flagellar biosynthesis GTPase FlhF